MRNRIKAADVPVVIVGAIAGAAGYRAQDFGSGRRLDELSQERPAAATHFPLDAAENEALEGQRAQSRNAPARTGRGGGSGGICDPGSIVQRESKGDPNAVSPSSGAGGKYQFLPSTWSGGAGSSHGGC